MNRTVRNQQGFTLLELSIVLVIIGLIIGGITAGQELIRSAELNSVASDIAKFKVANNTFKLKYNAMAGDMDNAQSYWPSCVDVTLNACNGDSNGVLNSFSEQQRFWQHLSLAGVINGSYTGGQSSGERYPSLLNNSLIAFYVTDYNNKNDEVETVDGHMLRQNFDNTEIFEAEMAQLDIKYDDGLPESGEYRMFILDGSSSNCLTSTVPTEYDFAATGDYEDCNPAFLF